MYQRDFILRLISELMRFLTIILKLKKEGNFGEALKMIDDVSWSLLHVQQSDIDSMPVDELPSFIVGKQFQEQQIEALAMLLKEKGDIQEEQHNIFSASATLEKSLVLFEISKQMSNSYSQQREDTVTEIKTRLIRLKG